MPRRRRAARRADSVVAIVEPVVTSLRTGAEIRVTGDPAQRAVVCMNGGTASDAAGTWSASLEWLARRLSPELPELGLVEVRYRVKSWNRLRLCIEDAAAALDAVVARGAREVALVGYSMGGAVSLGIAAHPAVTTVIGLAPWFPDRLPVTALRGRRLAVLHGTLDRRLPGIAGVSPESSRRAFERARTLGIEATYTLVPGGLHGIAARTPTGGTIPLPRARRWRELLRAELERFQTPEA
jgi:pimeloyl-ACP methyl ester carboxylesterase